MQELIQNGLMIMLPIMWLAFPITATLAASKVSYLYSDKSGKAGYNLKRRTWGPSYKDTKKILQSTDDAYTRLKAKESIKLWKISFKCLYISIVLYIVILALNKPD